MTRNTRYFSVALATVSILASATSLVHADTSAKRWTADQQSSKKSDIELTRKIRQNLVKDDSLSTNAHNVKIISSEGKVVLKGHVASDEEKANVENRARGIAGEANVHSELEVAQ